MIKRIVSKKNTNKKTLKSDLEIDLLNGSIKVDIKNVGTSSTSTSSPREIRKEFQKAAENETFIPPTINE